MKEKKKKKNTGSAHSCGSAFSGCCRFCTGRIKK